MTVETPGRVLALTLICAPFMVAAGGDAADLAPTARELADP